MTQQVGHKAPPDSTRRLVAEWSGDCFTLCHPLEMKSKMKEKTFHYGSNGGIMIAHSLAAGSSSSSSFWLLFNFLWVCLWAECCV
jgi:hypothetical protein